MFSKINVVSIIIGHFQTLKEYGNANISLWDVTMFYIMPILASFAIVYNEILIDNNVATALMSALAIFAGLLFNLLLLAHGIIKTIVGTDDVSLEKRGLLRELYVNISYSIIVTVVAFLPILVNFLSKSNSVKCVTSFITYFLTLNFLLTLLMILKRVNTLLSKEFEEVV